LSLVEAKSRRLYMRQRGLNYRAIRLLLGLCGHRLRDVERRKRETLWWVFRRLTL